MILTFARALPILTAAGDGPPRRKGNVMQDEREDLTTDPSGAPGVDSYDGPIEPGSYLDI